MNIHKKILAGAAMVAAASSVNAATGVINLDIAVTNHTGPAEHASLFGNIVGQQLTGQILIPEFDSYFGGIDWDNEENPVIPTGTVVVPFDGSESSPSIALRNDILREVEGEWSMVANPDYDPSQPACWSWRDCEPVNSPAYWTSVADSSPLGDASLTFVDGVLTSVNYTVGRDVLAGYDPFIQELSDFALQEITIELSNFSLGTADGSDVIADNGWQYTGGSLVYLTPAEWNVTVATMASPVPLPAAFPLFLGAMGFLGWAGRRKQAA